MDGEVQIVDPEHVGRRPKDIFAIEQTGVFSGTEGKRKTVVELTHDRKRVDHAVELVQAYGSEEHKYRVSYGKIVWETETIIGPAPKEAPEPMPEYVNGVRMIGDMPAKQPGKSAAKPKKGKK